MEFFSSKDTNLDILAGASWQNACTSHILVTLSGVNIELDDHLEGLLKFAFLRDSARSLENFSCLILFFGVGEHYLVKVAGDATVSKFDLAGLLGVKSLQN